MINSTDISLYTDDLTPEMQAAAVTMSQQLDVASHEGLFSVGNAARSRMSSVSTGLLEAALDGDFSPVLDDFSQVAKHISDFSTSLKGGRSLATARGKAKVRDRYDSVRVELLRVTARLDSSRRQLVRTLMLLEESHTSNLGIYQELGVDIEALRLKLAELQSEPAGNEAHIRRVEAKLTDMETSRMVCRQTAVQIFLLRDSCASLLDRINTINQSVIPLWTTQVSLALGISSIRGRELSSASAFQAITDATSSLADAVAATRDSLSATSKASEDIRA